MIRLGGLVNQKAFGKFEQGKVVSNPMHTAFIKEAEGEDHEVSIANNSLDTIIKMATELKAKMGENEKDIPAWIQDHITNAENFISQASSNYHEYGNKNEGKINEMAPNDIHFKQVMNFYDKGTASTKKAVSIFVSGKMNANRNQILDDLGDMDYNEILDVVDHFKLDEAKVKYHKTITKADWNKKQKDSKTIINGIHYLMFYDDKIGTYLAPVMVEGSTSLKTMMNEASEVELGEIPIDKAKKVMAFEKIIGGKHSAIFDGIHGMIVDIEVKGQSPDAYRFSSNDLKKLLSLGVRWVEASGNYVSIAF
jgi:hypothetical protein